MRRLLLQGLVASLIAGLAATGANAACCYFSAKDKDINQPGQKVFITWDPTEKIETFTVQPKFEGNALDFGMVIPTPSKPRLDEMPKDFFKDLAVFTILKKREHPKSKLLPEPVVRPLAAAGPGRAMAKGKAEKKEKAPTVKVLEAGVVGTLDYKIISAEEAKDLFDWLKENKYNYAG